MKKQIHELRTRIDGLAQLVKSLYPCIIPIEMIQYMPDSMLNTNMESVFNLRDCYKSILLAKAWLGKVLAELGEKTPYKNDGTLKTVDDIEPTADSSSGEGLFKDDFQLLWWKNELNYIEKIDWLREEIKKTKGLIDDLADDDRWYDIADILESVETHLIEARFHLGFELQRLKEHER